MTAKTDMRKPIKVPNTQINALLGLDFNSGMNEVLIVLNAYSSDISEIICFFNFAISFHGMPFVF